MPPPDRRGRHLRRDSPPGEWSGTRILLTTVLVALGGAVLAWLVALLLDRS